MQLPEKRVAFAKPRAFVPCNALSKSVRSFNTSLLPKREDHTVTRKIGPNGHHPWRHHVRILTVANKTHLLTVCFRSWLTAPPDVELRFRPSTAPSNSMYTSFAAGSNWYSNTRSAPIKYRPSPNPSIARQLHHVALLISANPTYTVYNAKLFARASMAQFLDSSNLSLFVIHIFIISVFRVDFSCCHTWSIHWFDIRQTHEFNCQCMSSIHVSQNSLCHQT